MECVALLCGTQSTVAYPFDNAWCRTSARFFIDTSIHFITKVTTLVLGQACRCIQLSKQTKFWSNGNILRHDSPTSRRHFMYYSCAWVPLLFTAHPLHFLYVKFHADIAPIGGHDGYDEPSANGDFHWLHHAHCECNYGGKSRVLCNRFVPCEAL